MVQKKVFRYYYWLVLEFIKKNFQFILISFFLSFILIISAISISPFISTFLFKNKEVIGVVGNYDFRNLPDEILSQISNGLIFINDKGEIIPALSSSWQQLDSGKTYRFHLRNNLIWSNGKPFNAHDINYNFTDVEIKVVGPNTINFKLKRPLAIFPTYLTKPITKYPLDGVAGLYKVNRIKTKYGYLKEVHLSPNKKDLPIIIYKFYDSENKLFDAYKLGEINEVKTSKKKIADMFINWKNTKIEKIIDYSQVLAVFFNMNREIMKESAFRQALQMSIPIEDFKTRGEIAAGPIPPVSWAYNTSLKKKIFDPEQARKNIEKYISASESATLNVYTYYDYLDETDMISESLKNIGLKINLKLISDEKPNNFDLLVAYWKIPQDPDQYYFWHSTQTQGNISNYKNVKVDKLLEDARGTILITERKKLYQKFQEVFVDDPPAYLLYYPYIYKIKRQ